MGLSEGAVLTLDVEKHEVIGYDGVDMPSPGLVDQLYQEQVTHFAPEEQLAVA